MDDWFFGDKDLMRKAKELLHPYSVPLFDYKTLPILSSSIELKDQLVKFYPKRDNTYIPQSECQSFTYDPIVETLRVSTLCYTSFCNKTKNDERIRKSIDKVMSISLNNDTISLSMYQKQEKLCEKNIQNINNSVLITNGNNMKAFLIPTLSFLSNECKLALLVHLSLSRILALDSSLGTKFLRPIAAGYYYLGPNYMNNTSEIMNNTKLDNELSQVVENDIGDNDQEGEYTENSCLKVMYAIQWNDNLVLLREYIRKIEKKRKKMIYFNKRSRKYELNNDYSEEDKENNMNYVNMSSQSNGSTISINNTSSQSNKARSRISHPWKESILLAREIAFTIALLHQKGLYIRYLDPDEIYIGNEEVKLIGLVATLPEEKDGEEQGGKDNEDSNSINSQSKVKKKSNLVKKLLKQNIIAVGRIILEIISPKVPIKEEELTNSYKMNEWIHDNFDHNNMKDYLKNQKVTNNSTKLINSSSQYLCPERFQALGEWCVDPRPNHGCPSLAYCVKELDSLLDLLSYSKFSLGDMEEEDVEDKLEIETDETESNNEEECEPIKNFPMNMKYLNTNKHSSLKNSINPNDSTKTVTFSNDIDIVSNNTIINSMKETTDKKIFSNQQSNKFFTSSSKPSPSSSISFSSKYPLSSNIETDFNSYSSILRSSPKPKFTVDTEANSSLNHRSILRSSSPIIISTNLETESRDYKNPNVYSSSTSIQTFSPHSRSEIPSCSSRDNKSLASFTSPLSSPSISIPLTPKESSFITFNSNSADKPSRVGGNSSYSPPSRSKINVINNNMKIMPKLQRNGSGKHLSLSSSNESSDLACISQIASKLYKDIVSIEEKIKHL